MVNTEWDPTGGAIALGICAMPFVPIVDGKFLLKDNPERILQSGELRKTPVLLGANREEGTYFLIYFLTHLFKLQHNVSTGWDGMAAPRTGQGEVSFITQYIKLSGFFATMFLARVWSFEASFFP